MQQYTQAMFAPLAGETFSVTPAEGEPVELRLASVDGTPDANKRDPAGNAAMDGFSLLFVGSPEQPLEQSTCEISHPELGTHELFLTPVVSEDPKVRAYEVVVSWLIEP